MKKIIVSFLFLLVFSACNAPDDAPRYFYKTIKPNINPYTAWKKDKDAAIKLANIEMEKLSKSSCRTQGVGWHLKGMNNKGELDCEESADGHRCRFTNVKFDCQKNDER